MSCCRIPSLVVSLHTSTPGLYRERDSTSCHWYFTEKSFPFVFHSRLDRLSFDSNPIFTISFPSRRWRLNNGTSHLKSIITSAEVCPFLIANANSSRENPYKREINFHWEPVMWLHQMTVNEHSSLFGNQKWWIWNLEKQKWSSMTRYRSFPSVDIHICKTLLSFLFPLFYSYVTVSLAYSWMNGRDLDTIPRQAGAFQWEQVMGLYIV